jgi:GTP-binding protein
MNPPAPDRAALPVVAILGRPNTGKSTLFNRLTRSRRAVVASTPGVTRDRNMAVAEYAGRDYVVVDTGGFEAEERAEMAQAVQAQSLLAAAEADAVILVLDGRAGLSPLDRALIGRLRAAGKPLFVAVNKIDTPRHEALQHDFYALGVEPLYPISAEHGRQVDVLMDAVAASFPPPAPAPAAGGTRPIGIAIIGRPNVGKSSLLNRLVGQERAIVDAAPGTTRDAIDTTVRRGGQEYVLVDTAGIRRRPRVQEGIERASVVRALRAIERADLALLIVDLVEGLTEQDARVSTYAWERGRGLVVVFNKWDALPRAARDPARIARAAAARFPSLALVPKLFVSALTGEGTERLWPAIARVAAGQHLRLQTATLNQVLAQAAAAQPPPSVKGKRPRLLYATQTGTAPPVVTIFTAAPERVHQAYARYLLNQFHAAFPLAGVPLRIVFRARERRPARPRRTRAARTS